MEGADPDCTDVDTTLREVLVVSEATGDCKNYVRTITPPSDTSTPSSECAASGNLGSEQQKEPGVRELRSFYRVSVDMERLYIETFHDGIADLELSRESWLFLV